MSKKSLSLVKAHELLSQAKAVIVNGDGLSYPEVDILTGDPENQWMKLAYTDGDGADYVWYFTEEEQVIHILGNVIYMLDDEDDMCEIELLGPLKVNL